MKIQITKEAKKWLTVAEMPIVKQIIADFRDGDNSEVTAKEIAEYATAVIFNGQSADKILEASAEIAGNQRIYNYYSDESGRLDIWITFTAFHDYFGFVIGGCYLSDIWNLSDETREEIKSHMYIREFKENR